MYEDLLKNIGLTENETKVYLSLLKIGLSTTSRIVEDSQISSGKIYETLNKLHKKGLVAVTEMNGIKHFQITSPKALLTYIDEQKKELEEKEIQLEKILPGLIELQLSYPKKTSVNLIVGERSIRPLVIDLFSNAKQIICAMGLRGSKNPKHNNFWWHITSSIAERKKKKSYYLFSENKTEYFKKHKKLKSVKIKYNEGITPTAIDIIDHHVLIFSYKEEMTCIHIIDEDIAESFRSFFMTLWKISKV